MEDTRIRFDWAPPEVRTKEVRNFGLPGSQLFGGFAEGFEGFFKVYLGSLEGL